MLSFKNCNFTKIAFCIPWSLIALNHCQYNPLQPNIKRVLETPIFGPCLQMIPVENLPIYRGVTDNVQYDLQTSQFHNLYKFLKHVLSNSFPGFKFKFQFQAHFKFHTNFISQHLRTD